MDKKLRRNHETLIQKAYIIAGSRNRLSKYLGVSRTAVGKWVSGDWHDLKSSSIDKLQQYIKENNA